MSVDVIAVNDTAIRTGRPGGPCPDWCTTDHMPPHCDDGVHCSTPLFVELSTEQKQQHEFTNGAVPQVTVGVQHHPGAEPFVMLTHHDDRAISEDKLTVTEADQVAAALEKNASIIRACGVNTCWCDGNHGPGDIHWGESEDITPRLMPVPNPITVAIQRGWVESAARVGLDSHTARMWDLLTPDEADHLALSLRRCGAILAVYQAGIRLNGLSDGTSGVMHGFHPDYVGGPC